MATPKNRKRKPSTPRPVEAPAAPLPSRRPRREPETLRARSLIPALTTGDLRRSIGFYVDALGFVLQDHWEEEGALKGVTLKAGRVELMLVQDDFLLGRDRKKGVGQRLWLATTQPIDGLASRLQERGFRLDREPGPLPWGPRAFAVTDPDGFHLTITQG